MFGNNERLFISLFCVVSTFGLELGPGIPVPHSDELKRMIIGYIFNRPSDINGDSILNYITGKSDTIPDPEKELRRLNVSLLTPEGLKMVAKFAKFRNWDEHVELEANLTNMRIGEEDIGRAIGRDKTSPSGRRLGLYRWDKWDQARFIDRPESYQYIRMAISFMQEAIYSTRYNLKRTKPYRKRYQNNYLFHLGTQFGMLMQMRIKMETTHYLLSNLSYYWVKFHWFIIMYERILQSHMDISMTVQRMFELYRRFKVRRNSPAFQYFYANEMDKDTK